MTYVMSDIHGYGERFENVMKKINLQPNDTLYILGDVIDRYPDGIRLLRKIMKMPNVKMLLGNHEYMMMNYLVYPVSDRIDKWERQHKKEERKRLWYQNGGFVTHEYLKHIRKDIRQGVFDFIEQLPINITIEVNGQKYLLVHGGVEANYNPRNFKYRSSKEYAVWSRNSENEEIPDDTILIFGHTPTLRYQYDIPARLWKGTNRLGIDCGCGYGDMGRLLCLRLDDMTEFYSDM